jgi:hypothetical protein
MDKPHILAYADETGFFILFKEPVSIKFRNKISAAQCEVQLIPLSTPVSSR